jgi:hypothetical protein
MLLLLNYLVLELEIQLEIGHDTIDEYVKKATVILEARNAIPEIISRKINNIGKE